MNAQGTGTTIVQVTPQGQTSLFFAGSGLGLTTALTVLKSGVVVVGSIYAPSFAGTGTSAGCATVGTGFATTPTGSLLFLDGSGTVLLNYTNALLGGPWDMTAVERDDCTLLFISNALAGTVECHGQMSQGGGQQHHDHREWVCEPLRH